VRELEELILSVISMPRNELYAISKMLSGLVGVSWSSVGFLMSRSAPGPLGSGVSQDPMKTMPSKYLRGIPEIAETFDRF